MGHRHWGARIQYGDCLFFTISPNEQHSALVLKLSRYRRNDPCLAHADAAWKKLCSMDFPALAAKRRRTSGTTGVDADHDLPSLAPEEEVQIDLPEYDIRRVMTAEDPLAVVEAHRINICFRLAWLLGVRMCPSCPRCNDCEWGCQDLNGSNMRPFGGILGGALAFEGGTEYQAKATPHFHGQVHVVCVYQFSTLKKIAAKIEEGLLLTHDMKSFQDWYHVERPLNDEAHESYAGRAEQEFYARLKAPEHNPLCATSAFLQEDADAGSAGSISAGTYEHPATMKALETEGQRFLQQYYLDAQFVFSRVQHHVHKTCKDGKHEPLNACAKKQRGKKTTRISEICKHDFPRKATPGETVLICQGLAKKFNLKVSGRRNAYGIFLGRRTGAWQCGTTPGLAVHFRSNSHTMPNYRVPPTARSHEASCPSKSCARRCCGLFGQRTVKTVAKLAQRVQREATGYYCGYTFKPQPVSRKAIKTASSSLNYLTAGLEDKNEGQRMHRISNRLLIDMQHRCMTRPATEEWNLAAFQCEHDVTNAEFIRTFRSVDFVGGQLVARLEAEMKRVAEQPVSKAVNAPRQGKRRPGEELVLRHFPDLYGYRGNLPEAAAVYYLNPWEFVMLWDVMRLPTPCLTEDKRRQGPPALTIWEVRPDIENGVLGEYVLNPVAVQYYARFEDVLFYPDTPGRLNLRHTWYMQRRKRPMTPAPTGTPMPDGHMDAEKKSKLFSVYLRPWTLCSSWATAGRVPHITDLNLLVKPRRRCVVKTTVEEATETRSYEQAWRKYIRGQVVSRHALQIIVQFMSACCGKSSRDADVEEESARQSRICPPNEVQLERLHKIVDDLGEGISKDRGKKHKAEEEEASDEDDHKHRSAQMQDALHTTAGLWPRDKTPWPIEDVAPANRGNTRLRCKFIRGRVAQSQKRKRQRDDPNVTQARAYIRLEKTSIEAWWKKVGASDKPPTPEQQKFLKSVIARCFREQKELGRWNRPAKQGKTKSLSESLRLVLLGIPGAGKSHCIHLLRDLFQSCMNWSDGVQFQFLATQNTMAELIGGRTINTWGVIPPNKAAAGRKAQASQDVDWDQLFENALNLRWLVIDECSTLSPSLLSILESFLREKACVRHPYAFRVWRRGGAGKDPRPFGGINVIFAGDLWQLPPVQETAIFANPVRKATGELHDAGEQRIFSMFWDSKDDLHFASRSSLSHIAFLYKRASIGMFVVVEGWHA